MSNVLKVVNFTLNVPQARFLSAMANESWLLWSRGTGKTVGAIAPWVLHKVAAMPRSAGGLIGKSFQDLETKILQPLFLAFQMQGYEKDEHYVYGKKPPEWWEQPLTPVINYDHVISFRNGTTLELISLHVKGSANGKSLQWIVADEAKLLNENQLREEVFPILRGQKAHFGDSPWYGAKLFVTDKLSPNIHWLLAKKKLMNVAAVNAAIFYQLKVNELRQKMGEVSQRHAYRIQRKVERLEHILSRLRKKLVYYGEAKARENIENLGADYFDNMRRSLGDFEYRIAIDNEDPLRAENGFYPDRTTHHLYDIEHDDNILEPLAVALDYQASISPLVVAQVNDRVVPGQKTLNYLNSFYVKQPLGLRNVVDEFCNYYQYRPCKHVLYYYDHTAVGERNTHKKFYEEVTEYFEANGWTVTQVYMGAAPKQNIKYTRLQYFFKQENVEHYPIRIHMHRCAAMVISMDMAGTKETEEGTKKDKAPERDKNFPQEQATHFSDTFDQLTWGVCEQKQYPMYDDTGVSLGLR